MKEKRIVEILRNFGGLGLSKARYVADIISREMQGGTKPNSKKGKGS